MRLRFILSETWSSLKRNGCTFADRSQCRRDWLFA